MPNGRLEVQLLAAKGLENTEYFCNMDPYCIVKCCDQEQKSRIANGAGSAPKWDETLVFNISGDVSVLTVMIMDKDDYTADDFVGEAKIPLEPLFEGGHFPPTSYNVVKDGELKGEIRIGLFFRPQKNHRSRGCPQEDKEEELGGWKQSAPDH